MCAFLLRACECREREWRAAALMGKRWPEEDSGPAAAVAEPTGAKKVAARGGQCSLVERESQ